MPLEVNVAVDYKVTPEECIHVREAEVTPHSIELWRECLSQSLCVVTARVDGNIVGIGFIVGNRRHATIVDLVVHSAHREQGIGGKIMDELLSYTRSQKSAYVSLTYDRSKPWLQEFYARYGFRSVDFAMWQEHSLALLQ